MKMRMKRRMRIGRFREFVIPLSSLLIQESLCMWDTSGLQDGELQELLETHFRYGYKLLSSHDLQRVDI